MKEKLNPKNLDDLKTINLVELANNYNYKIDKKESTKKWTVLRNLQDDKLLVHQNENGHWSYTNMHNNSDKGSVYDFMKKENPTLNFKQIVEELSKFDPSKTVAAEKDFVGTANVFDKSHLKNISAINGNNINYLSQERKIDPDILLKDSRFKDKVQIYSSENFKNIAFPISNENKSISGYIIKNKDFSGYLKSSEHSNSLWVSNYDRTKPIDKLFVSESPIDAISHYQLNKTDIKDKNIVYMATGGSLTNGQVKLVDTFMNAKKISNIETIFDNDLGGRQFSAKLTGELKSIKKEGVADIKQIGFSTKKDDPNITMSVNFSNSDDKSLKEFYKNLEKDGFKFETTHSNKPDGSGKLEVSFLKESRAHWKEVNNFLNDFNKKKVVNTFSETKDFNKDLQMKNQQSYKNSFPSVKQ